MENNGISVKVIPRIAESVRPNILDLMKDGKVQLVINTPSGRIPKQDEVKIRSSVIKYNIPYTTTLSAAQATVNGIEMLRRKGFNVRSLQEYHKKSKVKSKK